MILGAAITITLMLLSTGPKQPGGDPAIAAMGDLISKGYSDIALLDGREGMCTDDVELAIRLMASGSLLKFEHQEDSYRPNCSFGAKFTATNPRGLTDGGVFWCGPMASSIIARVMKVAKERKTPELDLPLQVAGGCMVHWAIQQ